MKARLYILNGDIGVELTELAAIEKEDILISSDEISSYTIKYDPIDSKAECNVPVNVSYIIKRKIISEVKDTEKRTVIFYLIIQNLIALGVKFHKIIMTMLGS